MSWLSVNVKSDQLQKKIDKLYEAGRVGVPKAVQVGVFKAALFVRNDMIRRILKGPKSGTVYHRKGRGTRSKGRGGVDHTASAPGESPANDTGNLARSINVVAGSEGVSSTAIVTVRTPYAAALEFGTKKMEPRPFAQISVDENKALISQTIRDELAKVAS
jgi:HK97 gp10 family phage protein